MKRDRAYWPAPVRMTVADSQVTVGIGDTSWLLSPDQARYLTAPVANLALG